MRTDRTDHHLQDLLQQPFETDHGIVPTREATIREIRAALDDLAGTRERLVDRADRAGADVDALGHLVPRIAALGWQIEELLLVLDGIGAADHGQAAA